MTEQLELWGVNDPNISAQLALAAKLDLFKQEAGLEVVCKFIASGTTMPADVLKAKRKPFAFTQTPITSLVLHEQGFGTKVVAPLADIAGTQQVIIREANGITHPQEFEGKRIGLAQGSAVYLAVRNMANDCSVDIDKISFINLLPHAQLEAFEIGEIDAMACWEPWTTKAQTVGGKLYFSGNQSNIPGMEGDITWLVNQSCLIVPDAHLENEPGTVLAILKVLRKATELINSNRKAMAKELADFFGLSRVELIMAMQKNTYSMELDNLFRIGVLGFRDFLYDTRQVSVKFPEDALYDTRFLKQLDPSLVRLAETASQNITIVENDGIYYREDITTALAELPLKCLLADDSRFMRVTVARIIRKLGGEVIAEATTGSEAIEKFIRLRPNVVTMDLSMPGVSGIDAIKEIFKEDPAVNILVISSTNLQEVREQVFNLGVKMFITKPFDAKEITAILRKNIVKWGESRD